MLDQKTIDAICDLAAKSELAQYKWSGRGRAPIGYIKGLACTYALVLKKLQAKDSAALAMVRIVDDGRDVFDHYEDKLSAARIITEGASDVDRLRALWIILTGLGMRESSGGVDIGRDSSANNVTADTAEAGIWQQSWGSRRTSPEIEKLFHSSQLLSGPGRIDFIFSEGVKTRPGAFENYGDGDGEAFQKYCKNYPTFAAQCAAIGLRTLYTEWGPIIRREAEIVAAADNLFRQVQALIGIQSAPPATSGGGWLAAVIGALGVIGALFRRNSDVSPPNSAASGEPAWMRAAAKEIGFHEIGENRGLGKYIKLAKTGEDGDPWCAIFVNAMLESCGIRGTRSAMARSFEHSDQFVKLSGPAHGAITTMWRGSPGSGLGHVFFYAGENDKGILALGGNQSDQVCKQYEPRNRVVGYWWPKSVPLPKIGKVSVSDAGHSEGSET
jgi:uncharacterized protein (TIGR02594 family)